MMKEFEGVHGGKGEVGEAVGGAIRKAELQYSACWLPPDWHERLRQCGLLAGE